MIDNWDWPENPWEVNKIICGLMIHLIDGLELDFQRYEPSPVPILLQAIFCEKLRDELLPYEPRLKRVCSEQTEFDNNMLALLRFVLPTNHLPLNIDSVEDNFNLLFKRSGFSPKRLEQEIDEFLRPILGEPLW